MKISKSSGIRLLKAYTSQVKNNKAGYGQGEKAGKTDRCDRAVISPQARELQAIMAELRNLPEVREDLVQSLKEKIQEGSYHPDTVKIAEGIIAEHKPKGD